jgi:hypothetical protein
MRFIPTKTHGLIDYLSVGFLFGLPRILKWSKTVTNLMTGAALGTLLYSLFTRYELGAIKTIPFEAHLSLDALSGAAFCAAPLLLKDEDRTVNASLMGIGLFEIAAALTSETQTAAE